MVNTWVILKNNSFLAQKDILPSHTPYVIPLNQIHSYIYFFTCKQQHIHELKTQHHIKVVWELQKLLVSTTQTHSYILMNAGTSNNNKPHENILLPWSLPCTYTNQRCHCKTRFKSNILYVCGLLYQSQSLEQPHRDFTIQFIEFTYYNDRFFLDVVLAKINKYLPLLNNIQRSWL